ncbi:PqqD family protein [Micromonospora sp. KLBMP9576]|uniref:PqqD family protein n=1 Tax=Micromonospora sp. KLBMP9576 TaxID=3424769 RepID=UPI003D8A27F9
MTSVQAVTPDTVLRRAPAARFRKFRSKLFVANASLAFELDEVAEFIFRQVDGTATVRQIGERLAAEYDVAVEEAVTDCGELLAHLAENGMVDTA